MTFAYPMQKFQDWMTQQWVILRGRKIKREDFDTLIAMKTFQLFILLFIFISCKKENIYYYSDSKQIKDSTVIRFVDDELLKLKINTQEKNLKIYTTLDSTSYKTNLDSIRNKIFEKALTLNLKPEDQKAFDQWFRDSCC